MTSDRTRKALRVVASLAVIFAIVFASVWFLAFALCPSGSISRIVWTEFRDQDDVDAVCLGSSLGERSFDPAAFDAAYGTTSFNMCTPAQETSESYLGLKEAIENHDIDYVFYAVDLTGLCEDYDMYPGRVFLTEKWQGDSVLEPLSDLAYALRDCPWMFGEKSLNWMFPWTEQRVGFKEVPANMAMKLDGTSPAEAVKRNEATSGNDWDYFGQGYGGYNITYDYNSFGQDPVLGLAALPLNPVKLNFLAEFCDFCTENGVQLVAYVPPRPDFSLVDMEERYDEYTTTVGGLVREHGGLYYDFNLAKPELYDSREDYYQDFEHCNVTGAKMFSEALAKLLAKRDAGENVDDLFMTFDEKLQSIDDISVVMFTDEPAPEGGVVLRAECLAGPQVKPEYQFLLVDEQGNQTVLRDYSTDPEFLFAPDQPAESDTYTVRVNARKCGSTADYEKFAQREVVCPR